MQKLRMWLGGIACATANSLACWSVAAEASRREHGGRFEAPAERAAKAKPRLHQRVTLCMWQQPQCRAGSGSSRNAGLAAAAAAADRGRYLPRAALGGGGDKIRDKTGIAELCSARDKVGTWVVAYLNSSHGSARIFALRPQNRINFATEGLTSRCARLTSR
jgi:hypothetical protein